MPHSSKEEHLTVNQKVVVSESTVAAINKRVVEVYTIYQQKEIMFPQLSWLEHLTHNQGVLGSSPSGNTMCPLDGIGRHDWLRTSCFGIASSSLAGGTKKNNMKIIRKLIDNPNYFT